MPSVPSYAAQENGYGQPPYMDHHWSMTGQYADSVRDNSFVGTGASEAYAVDPTPGSSKHFFSIETLRSRTLTDREQSRSTTGEPTRAGRPPARSMR